MIHSATLLSLSVTLEDLMASNNQTSKPLTKSEIVRKISEETTLTRKQVSAVFDTFEGLIKKSLGKRGPGMFVMPGILKIKLVHKPAVKARKGINPFTGESTTFKARPARNVVKVQALKKLKDMA
jgi:nucleoid DNA-binding protein